MNQKLIAFNKDLRGKEKLDFHSGDVIKIHLKIKEGEKERIQVFEGIIVGIKGRQSSSPTLTVRKISHGVGVEMIMPILSKNVEKIELVKKAKVRRAKLYYIRDLTAKQSRMKYKDMEEFIKKEEVKEEAKEKKEEKKTKPAEIESKKPAEDKEKKQ